MTIKVILTISAVVIRVGLANSPLKNYQLFNIIMDFFAAGGVG